MSTNPVNIPDNLQLITLYYNGHWGRIGFDVDTETQGACRGVDYLVNPATKLIVANDDNYALAA
jgi:hypothetical protein